MLYYNNILLEALKYSTEKIKIKRHFLDRNCSSSLQRVSNFRTSSHNKQCLWWVQMKWTVNLGSVSNSGPLGENHPFYSGAKWTYAYSTPLHDAGPVGFNEADLRLWNWLCWFFGAELLHGVVVFLLVFSHQQLQRTAGLCTKKQKNNFIKVYLRQTAHNYYKQRLHSEIDQAYILKSSRKPRMFTRLGL